jgi:hypothetical protein
MMADVHITFYVRTLFTCHIAKWITYWKYAIDEHQIRKIKADAKVWKFNFRGKRYLIFYWFTFRMIYK